jgi:hypothetical protein
MLRPVLELSIYLDPEILSSTCDRFDSFAPTRGIDLEQQQERYRS